MNNFFNILISNFSNLIKLYNKLLSNFFNKLNYKNLSTLILDKRVLITSLIIIVSIVAHFSTPAFYKTDRVKNLLENQLGNEFNLKLDLSNDLNYAIFPRPHFHFKNVFIKAGEKKFAIINSFRIYLSFKKFFDKEKLKIEYIKINKAKFNFETIDFPQLMSFFDKKLSDLNVDVLNSNVFLKDKEDDTISILKVDKAKIFYDSQYLKNKVNITGEIFNNPVIFSLKNDFNTKDMNFDIKMDKIGIHFNNIINYRGPTKLGSTSISNYGKKYSTIYTFDNKKFKFQSEKKTGDEYVYEGKALFKPFFMNINVNLLDISLINLIKSEALFMKLIRSKLFFNENLNLVLNLRSKKISDYRFLEDLDLKIELNQGIIDIKDTSLRFSEIALIKLLNGNFKKRENVDNFSAEFDINVLDSGKLYKFFQTKKDFRKQIKNINFVINYDFFSDSVTIERINIDDETNESVLDFIENFNSQESKLKNRVELRNLFNLLIESYAG